MCINSDDDEEDDEEKGEENEKELKENEKKVPEKNDPLIKNEKLSSKDDVELTPSTPSPLKEKNKIEKNDEQLAVEKFIEWLDLKNMVSSNEKYKTRVSKIEKFNTYDEEEITIYRSCDREIFSENKEEVQKEKNTYLVSFDATQELFLVKLSIKQFEEEKGQLSD